MRSRLIIGALVGLGLVAVPSFVQAGEGPQRAETRTVTQETRTVTRDARPVETVGHDDRVVVRDEHVQRDVRPVVINDHRDVRVDEHVVVDNRHWNHDRVDYIPAPVIVTTPVVVAPYCDTPVAINQVPPAVLNAAAARTGGAPIVGVDFVQNGQHVFYDVHVAGAYNTIQTLRFGIHGGFYGNL